VQGKRCSIYEKARSDPSAEKVTTTPQVSKQRKLAGMVNGIEMAFDHSSLLLSKQASGLQAMLDDISLERIKLAKTRKALLVAEELEEWRAHLVIY
jgi:hypothetical protein